MSAPADAPSLAAGGRGAWRRLVAALGLPAPLALLVVGHVGFGLVRFPVGAIQKRAESVAEWRRLGADGWCFRKADAETRAVARWLVEQVGPRDLVRYDGSQQGALQLLAPLLCPALLVHHGSDAAWPAGRPEFAPRTPWGDPPPGTVHVVVGSLGALRIEHRSPPR
jgi:hypothetical protein